MQPLSDIYPFENKLRIFQSPELRLIGKSMRHMNESDVAPIPMFWKEYHRKYEAITCSLPRLIPSTLAMIGEYDAATKEYTYMICVMCPMGTPVPEGFESRDLPSMLLAHGPASDHPPDAHSIERFEGDVEALGFRQGGDIGYGFEFYPYPDSDTCCLLFEVRRDAHISSKER